MTADKIVDESTPAKVETRLETDEVAGDGAEAEPARETDEAAELEADDAAARDAHDVIGLGTEGTAARGTDDVVDLPAEETAEVETGEVAELGAGGAVGLEGGDSAVVGAGGAAFAHAPTGRRARVDDVPLAGDYPDEPEVDDVEDDFDEEPVAGFDRRADMWWLITPLVTLFVAPLVAGVIGFFVTATGNHSPGVCEATLADNGCEEAVLRMVAQHTVAFGILWVGLWAMPWYRGLRKYRIALAVLAFAVLLAVPFRLISD